MKRTLSLSEAKMKLNRLIDRAQSAGDEFVITKNGSPAAVLVPAATYDGWSETEEIKSDPEFVKEIKKGVQKLRRGGKRFTFEDIFGEPLK